MSASARIVQINVSPGGVPKRPVPSARVTPGSIGENLTIEGVEWNAVTPGRYLLLGTEVVAQVTRYTSPCGNITASFRDRDYARVSQKRHPGESRVYARVLREGSLTSGDPVQLITEDEALALVGSR